jgi:hypothetical protein
MRSVPGRRRVERTRSFDEHARAAEPGRRCPASFSTLVSATDARRDYALALRRYSKHISRVKLACACRCPGVHMVLM